MNVKGAWILALSAVGACSSGRNFERPDAATLRLGETMHAEIVERFGKPQREGKTVVNGQELKLVHYSFSRHRDLGGAHAYGVVPARGISFEFLKNVLVSHAFTSSFEADYTDFDESKIVEIRKGETTRCDVVALLGPPQGECIYPIARESGQLGLVYSYAQLYSAFMTNALYHKIAVIVFDSKDVVVDVRFTASGER